MICLSNLYKTRNVKMATCGFTLCYKLEIFLQLVAGQHHGANKTSPKKTQHVALLFKITKTLLHSHPAICLSLLARTGHTSIPVHLWNASGYHLVYSTQLWASVGFYWHFRGPISQLWGWLEKGGIKTEKWLYLWVYDDNGGGLRGGGMSF